MSLNKVMLIGYLGQDPTVRYLESNRTVATFSLATHEVYKDKNGEKRTETEWHTIEMWDQLAKNIDDLKLRGLLNKGAQVYVEGKIRTEIYRDKNGVEHNRKKIKATHLSILNSPKPNEPEIYSEN